VSNFLKNIVARFPMLAGAGGPRTCIGVFGKHHAWNDHIHPDIGLDRQLSALKETLYSHGIRDHAIEVWRKAPPEHLIPFGHLAVWRLKETEHVVARLWYSPDGIGRDDFPLVVAAHITGANLDWVLTEVVPILLDVEGELQDAATHADPKPAQSAVHACVSQAGTRLRSLASTMADPAPAPDPLAALGAIVDTPDMAGEKLARVLHALQDLRPGSADRATAANIRVPRCTPSMSGAISLWAQGLEPVIGALPPTMFLLPDSADWIDILIGRQDPGTFMLIRASLKFVPLTSDISYSLDDRLVEWARTLAAEAIQHASPHASAEATAPADAPVPSAPSLPSAE
jgi:hypothetical protein